MLTRSVAQLDRLIVKNLHRIRAIPADVVVHCPRSGTIPASLIATYLYKPFCSVDEYCAGIINTRKSAYSDTDTILLVDDSIATGAQMKGFIERILAANPNAKIYTLAVYSYMGARHDFQPTLILEMHRNPDYIYSWFMWKTSRLRRCAIDMDGVLCRDVVAGEDDDGARYLNFLETAELKLKPMEYIPNADIVGAIVTGRLEKYRPQTEAWLKKHGVRYGKLIMCPAKTNEERRTMNVAIWKASVYANPNYKLFIESNDSEARIIFERTGKPVWCIDSCRSYP